MRDDRDLVDAARTAEDAKARAAEPIEVPHWVWLVLIALMGAGAIAAWVMG
jgi:hypothetical protein